MYHVMYQFNTNVCLFGFDYILGRKWTNYTASYHQQIPESDIISNASRSLQNINKKDNGPKIDSCGTAGFMIYQFITETYGLIFVWMANLK